MRFTAVLPTAAVITGASAWGKGYGHEEQAKEYSAEPALPSSSAVKPVGYLGAQSLTSTPSPYPTVASSSPAAYYAKVVASSSVIASPVLPSSSAPAVYPHSSAVPSAYWQDEPVHYSSSSVEAAPSVAEKYYRRHYGYGKDGESSYGKDEESSHAAPVYVSTSSVVYEHYAASSSAPVYAHESSSPVAPIIASSSVYYKPAVVSSAAPVYPVVSSVIPEPYVPSSSPVAAYGEHVPSSSPVAAYGEHARRAYGYAAVNSSSIANATAHAAYPTSSASVKVDAVYPSSSSMSAKVYAMTTSSYPVYSPIASSSVVVAPVLASKNSTAGYYKRYAEEPKTSSVVKKASPTSSKGYAMSTGYVAEAKAAPVSSKGYAMSTGHVEVAKAKTTGTPYEESIVKEYELEEEDKYEIEADSYLRKRSSPYGRVSSPYRLPSALLMKCSDVPVDTELANLGERAIYL